MNARAPRISTSGAALDRPDASVLEHYSTAAACGRLAAIYNDLAGTR